MTLTASEKEFLGRAVSMIVCAAVCTGLDSEKEDEAAAQLVVDGMAPRAKQWADNIISELDAMSMTALWVYKEMNHN